MLYAKTTAYPGITLRPIETDDLEFLYQLYAGTRAEEMVMLIDWSDSQKESFLRGQFQAQHSYYQQHYPDARYQLIVKAKAEIGRLYVQPMQNEIRLMDITILPAHRHAGIGSTLIQEVMDEADATQRFVSLHVEAENPAKKLYERMGFLVAGNVTFYKLMHWIPPGLTPIYETAN